MKSLVKQSTGEWAIYQEGAVYTSSIPKILSPDATMDGLKEYAMRFDNVTLDTSDLRIVSLNVTIDPSPETEVGTVSM